MAHIRGLSNFSPQIGKHGHPYFEIIVSMGRGKSQCSTRYYYNTAHSQATIRKETEQFAIKFEDKCHRGEIEPKKVRKQREQEEASRTYTVKRFIDDIYMPSLHTRCAPNTEDNYRRLLRLHIYPKIGDCLITTIRAAEISAFLRELLNEHSISIAEKCYTILNAAFNQAYSEEFIDKNPMDRIAKPKARKDDQHQEALSYTEAEVSYIISCIKNEPLIWQAIILFLIDSGCRIGECLGLQWKNVDFKYSRVKIDGSLNYNSKLGVFRGATKNGESREFCVSDDVMSLLSILWQQQQATVQSEYVFTLPPNTTPIHPQSPKRYFKKFGEKYGVEDFHPHKLRHTHISIAMANCIDPVSIAEKVGHKDIAVTFQKYSHHDQKKVFAETGLFRAAIEKAGNEST